MTEFQIRPARQADATAIARIHASTGARTGMQVPPGDGTSALELRFWRESIGYAEPQLHVACAAQEVVGVSGHNGDGFGLRVGIAKRPNRGRSGRENRCQTHERG